MGADVTERSLVQKLGELFGLTGTDDDQGCDCGCEEYEVDPDLGDSAEELAKAKLTTQARKRLPKSAFVFPARAPGSGSYPIHDLAHARNALARSSGKPEEGRVRAAVCRRYPQLPACKQRGGMAKDDGTLADEVELGERVEALEQKLDTLIGEEGPLAKIASKLDKLSEGEEKPPTVEAVEQRLETVAKEINDKLADVAGDIEKLSEGESSDTDSEPVAKGSSNGGEKASATRGILFDYED